MRLALRLIAVGLVVLATLAFAGVEQIAARNTELASYAAGERAVRLVERLDEVSAHLLDYHRAGSAAADRAQATSIAEALAAANREARSIALGDRLAGLQASWAEAERRPAPADLVRRTNAVLREAYLRIGTLSASVSAGDDGTLAEAALQTLPQANVQFERIVHMFVLADSDRADADPFGRVALTAAYTDAASTARVALDPRWFAGLPPVVRDQAAATRDATAVFLEAFRTHVVRGDALRSRKQLLVPATAASAKVAALEATLLPLLAAHLTDAEGRARTAIAVVLALIVAIVAIVLLLSLQVISSQRRARRTRAAFAHQALHDALTGLPNRRAFTQAVAKAVGGWTPVNDRTTWIISIDMDYFKEVNDRYGHQAGDEFLVATAQRLQGATPAGDMVARVGGDEFAVLVHHYDPDSAHAQQVGEAICAAFLEPIRVEGVEHRLAASVGIVAVDALHETVDSLLRDADIAMYRAKEEGGDRVVVFDDVLRAEIIDRAELASDLRAALEREGGPRVVFQPIVALDDRTVHGFEALVRWRHPHRGEIPASLLIDVAQEARLIVPLGRRIVHEVCRHLAEWRDGGLDLTTLSVHVNISPMEAAHVGTYASIADAMETWGIPAQTLVIELTETASIDSIDTAGRFLASLHTLGVQVCLDDFGTGYSSLRHLNDFRVDAIKIDRSFVVSAANDAAKIPIIAGIIALARGLNAEIIAEGIETAEQRNLVNGLGCRLVQGYLFGRPMPPEDAYRFAQRTMAATVPAAQAASS